MRFLTKVNAESTKTYYHVTESKNVKSILKTGLQPKIGELSKGVEPKPTIFIPNQPDTKGNEFYEAVCFKPIPPQYIKVFKEV